MTIPSWHEYFMRHVYLASSKSKDPSTQIGAVLVRDKSIFSEGYNGLCRGVDDNVAERLARPEKYFWFEHGERNAIYNAARKGISTLGSTMFTNGIPCADCARAVIQAGVETVCVHSEWDESQSSGKWNESCGKSLVMLKEAGVKIETFTGKLGLETLRNGKIIQV